MKKTTAHLELVGAFKKDPQRKRPNEPDCREPVGKAPSRLLPQQKKAWKFLVDSTGDVPGVLTKLDRAFLELCAIGLAGIWDSNVEGGTVPQSALKAVGAMLAKLGMTPTDRSSVVVPRRNEKGAYDDFKAT